MAQENIGFGRTVLAHSVLKQLGNPQRIAKLFSHCTSKTVGPKLRHTSEPEILVAEQGKSPQAPFVVVKAI
ncbi:MAG: hypothetical protein ACLTOS_12115 [Ruthenibacterium lactatiformans]